MARSAPQKGQRTGSGDQNKVAEAARTGEQLGTIEVGNTGKQAVGTRDNGVGTWEQVMAAAGNRETKGLGNPEGGGDQRTRKNWRCRSFCERIWEVGEGGNGTGVCTEE